VSPTATLARSGGVPRVSLTTAVLAHIESQIDSARGLLGVVLEQGMAIRARDVHAVVRLAGIMRGEMGRRALLEEERAHLLQRSAEQLGIPAETVTLSRLSTLMDSEGAQRASVRSAELRGLLHELGREHACNRALMQVELGFLDHLMRMLSLDGNHGYDPHGESTSSVQPRPHGGLHVLDLRA
jgi:hypothetical protein